jgi:hypothetical protein
VNEAPPSIESHGSFVAALRWGVQRAIALEARLIYFVDPTFANWPLDDSEIFQWLAEWLRRPGRRLCLLAATYDEVPRLWPRFTAWRRDWAHAIDAWQAPAESIGELPTLLCSDSGISVQLADAAQWRGSAAVDHRQARLWRDQVDALLQRSERAFAASTLGL